MSEIEDLLGIELLPFGLDLISSCRAEDYNSAVSSEYRVRDFGKKDALLVLVSNTKAIWEPFLSAFRSERELFESAHPLDRYVTNAVQKALEKTNVPYLAYHGYEPPPRRVAMQALAECTGLAFRAPSQLSIHPVYGPWIAFRTAIVFDVERKEAKPPPAPACPACAETCAPALQKALSLVRDRVVTRADVEADWKIWLSVRDACPVGREHRYSDAQIRYHYAGDRSVLVSFS